MRRRQGGGGRRGREDQHGRVRHGLVDRELRVRRHAQPARSGPRAGRELRWLGRRGRGRARADGARIGHGRLRAPAGGVLRRRRHQAHVRSGEPVRAGRLRVVARPGRHARQDASPTRRACSTVVSGHDDRDATSARRAVPDFEAAVGRGVEGARGRACPTEYMPDTLDPALSDGRSTAALDVAASGGGRDPRGVAPAHALRDPLLLRDRVRRRPRATCPATTGCGTGCASRSPTSWRCTRRPGRAGLGAEVKRRIMLGTLRAVGRLLRRLLRHGAEGPAPHHRGLPERVRGRRRRALHADDARRRPSRSASARRSGGDVPVRRVHGDREPRGHPGRLGAGRRGAAACPSGRSSWPRGGARRRCSRPPARSRSGAGGGGRVSWEAVIGLEVHVQLRTERKLFCGNRVVFGDEPNTPRLPRLPRPARGASDHEPRGGRARREDGARARRARSTSAASGRARTTSIRTSPRATRSRSSSSPIATDGLVAFDGRGRAGDACASAGRTWRRTRASPLHDRVPGATAVDLNRAGTPLVEIVTEPDLRSPADAQRVPQLRSSSSSSTWT